ncbi:MAG TPA: hypothetical protein VEB21_09045 [Terriglobales bacterium]|nr:hypothetical protein [Terriglobales bacterium]
MNLVLRMFLLGLLVTVNVTMAALLMVAASIVFPPLGLMSLALEEALGINTRAFHRDFLPVISVRFWTFFEIIFGVVLWHAQRKRNPWLRQAARSGLVAGLMGLLHLAIVYHVDPMAGPFGWLIDLMASSLTSGGSRDGAVLMLGVFLPPLIWSTIAFSAVAVFEAAGQRRNRKESITD